MRIYPPDRFDKGVRESVESLWDWYAATSVSGMQPDDAERVRGGEAPLAVPRLVYQRVDAACRRHALERSLLAARIGAVARLQDGAGPENGADLKTVLHDFAGGHAEMLARLAGFKGAWQIRGARSFGEGIALAANLLNMRADTRAGACLLPRLELANAGIAPADLAGGQCPKGYRRIAWKQSIRARDLLAGATDFIREMDLRDRLYAKRVWLGTLEIIHALDRADFDVWVRQPELGTIARARVGIQSIFGRTVFRRR